MERKHQLPSVEFIRERLHYDAATGIFTWRQDVKTGRGRVLAKAGDMAGSITTSVPKKPYIVINIGGCPRLAHRLAWLYVYGAWPEHRIDHRDGSGLNNRIENLRDVTASVNSQNMRSPMCSKKHGVLLGTAWHEGTGKWRALIRVDGRQKSLGYYFTEQEAHDVYLSGKRRLHEGCTI